MSNLNDFLKAYLRERPLFLSLIRAKEAELYQKYLPLKRPVLDVGCGDGYFANVTFAKSIKYQISKIKNKGKIIDVGLDVRDSRVKEARRLGVYKKIVIYDGKAMPFPNNYFSTIISNSVLEHVEDLDTVLKEIYRVLKKDGVFITTVMAKPWEDNLLGAKILGSFYKKWMRKKQVHINLLTKKEWDERLKKAGFKIQETIGYLTPRACQLIEICHYLSTPSLISYKLTKKWVWWPGLTKIYPLRYFTKVLSEKIPAERVGALFYVLQEIR